MLEYEVNNRSGLIAAIEAATQPTFEAARENPVVIKNGSATYKFPNGISEVRGKELLANIRKISAKAFDIA